MIGEDRAHTKIAVAHMGKILSKGDKLPHAFAISIKDLRGLSMMGSATTGSFSGSVSRSIKYPSHQSQFSSTSSSRLPVKIPSVCRLPGKIPLFGWSAWSQSVGCLVKCGCSGGATMGSMIRYNTCLGVGHEALVLVNETKLA